MRVVFTLFVGGSCIIFYAHILLPRVYPWLTALMIIRLHSKWCCNKRYKAQEIGLSVIFSPFTSYHVLHESFIQENTWKKKRTRKEKELRDIVVYHIIKYYPLRYMILITSFCCYHTPIFFNISLLLRKKESHLKILNIDGFFISG